MFPSATHILQYAKNRLQPQLQLKWKERIKNLE